LVVSWSGPQCPLPLALLVLCDVRRVKVPVHDPRPCRSMRHAPRGRHLHIIKCLTYKKINSGPIKSQNELILFTYLKVLLLGQRHISCPCCDHYWRPRLCRVFLHSAKSPLHSAKTLLSVALGKVRSAKFFSAKGLCRVLFIGALGKIKNNFAECLGRHSAKYFRSFHRSRLFC